MLLWVPMMMMHDEKHCIDMIFLFSPNCLCLHRHDTTPVVIFCQGYFAPYEIINGEGRLIVFGVSNVVVLIYENVLIARGGYAWHSFHPMSSLPAIATAHRAHLTIHPSSQQTPWIRIIQSLPAIYLQTYPYPFPILKHVLFFLVLTWW